MPLVPTRVGMIPQKVAKSKKIDSCPHTRGDDPYNTDFTKRVYYLSPHAWG